MKKLIFSVAMLACQLGANAQNDAQQLDGMSVCLNAITNLNYDKYMCQYMENTANTFRQILPLTALFPNDNGFRFVDPVSFCLQNEEPGADGTRKMQLWEIHLDESKYSSKAL